MSERRDAGDWAAEELLLRVAWYYYKDDMNQEDIARRLSVSRPSVGRMLDRARKAGLVSISINSRYLASVELATSLCSAFGLTEALVVPDVPGATPLQRAVNARIGMAGAQYLSSHLERGTSLGVGWGDTVSRVMATVDLASLSPLRLVTLTGGVDGYLQALSQWRWDPAGAGTGGAGATGASEGLSAGVIPSPIVMSTAALAKAIKAEPTVQAVLSAARAATCAVVGVGTPAADSTLVRMGYLSADDAGVLAGQGVVGDILGQFFTADGTVVPLALHERRIGIELGDLKGIDTVVGVAGGVAKVDAIAGALRGAYLDVLVTNEEVARLLLERV